MIPSGSVFNLASGELPIIVEVQEDQERPPNNQKVAQTLFRYTQERSAVENWLANNKGHVNKKDADGYTVLHRLAGMAVKEEDKAPRVLKKAPERLSIADMLLRQGASPDTPSSRENLTPLQLAAVHDDAELFELFLTRKFDLDFDELSILFQLAVRSGGASVLGSPD